MKPSLVYQLRVRTWAYMIYHLWGDEWRYQKFRRYGRPCHLNARKIPATVDVYHSTHTIKSNKSENKPSCTNWTRKCLEMAIGIEYLHGYGSSVHKKKIPIFESIDLRHQSSTDILRPSNEITIETPMTEKNPTSQTPEWSRSTGRLLSRTLWYRGRCFVYWGSMYYSIQITDWLDDIRIYSYFSEVRRQFSLWTLPCIHMQIRKQNCTENIRKWFATLFIACVTFISPYSPTNLLYYWLTRVSRTIWANTSNCIKHIAVKMIYLGTSVHDSSIHFMWLSIFAMPNPPLWAHLIIFRIFHLTAWCLLCFPLNLSRDCNISIVTQRNVFDCKSAVLNWSKIIFRHTYLNARRFPSYPGRMIPESEWHRCATPHSHFWKTRTSFNDWEITPDVLNISTGKVQMTRWFASELAVGEPFGWDLYWQRIEFLSIHNNIWYSTHDLNDDWFLWSSIRSVSNEQNYQLLNSTWQISFISLAPSTPSLPINFMACLFNGFLAFPLQW